jgi:hypothetical protein
MKISLLYFSIFILLFSCNNQSADEQSSTSDSINAGGLINKTDSSEAGRANLNTLNSKVTPHSTLDSLQGAWISSIDDRDHVNIISHQYIETYEGDTAIRRTKIFFADTCLSDILTYEDRNKLDDTRENGKYMVLSDITDSSDNLCYQIDYIDGDHLVLIYHGKTLDFHK